MKKVTIAAVVSILALVLLGALASVSDGCQPGKPCNNPLPTNDGVNGGPVACDPPGGGKGPEHKCTPTPTPVPPVEQPSSPTPTELPPTEEPTAQPTATPKATEAPPTVVNTVEPTAQPTATPKATEAPPTVVNTVEPTTQPIVQVTATVEPTATITATVEVCDETCDPCALLLEALADGHTVIITDSDNVTIIEDGSVYVDGELLATGQLSETQ